MIWSAFQKFEFRITISRMSCTSWKMYGIHYYLNRLSMPIVRVFRGMQNRKWRKSMSEELKLDFPVRRIFPRRGKAPEGRIENERKRWKPHRRLFFRIIKYSRNMYPPGSLKEIPYVEHQECFLFFNAFLLIFESILVQQIPHKIWLYIMHSTRIYSIFK